MWRDKLEGFFVLIALLWTIMLQSIEDMGNNTHLTATF